MCVDLQEPNKVIIMDCHPLSLMEELFAELRGSTVFPTIDLACVYHQVTLHEDSRDLTAFIKHEGLFQYWRVPYGLASAPAAFQKLLVTIIQGLPVIQNYLEDIIIYGCSKVEHNTNLSAVLYHFHEAGLKLNTQKCSFNQTSLCFLGHFISKDGLLPDSDHIAAIVEAPAPLDIISLRSFLRLTSWYSKFSPNYATVIEPIRTLLRSESDVKFT